MINNPFASAGDTRDTGSSPGLARSPGGGNDNLLQYSCLGWTEKPGGYSLWGCKVSDMTEELSTA